MLNTISKTILAIIVCTTPVYGVDQDRRSILETTKGDCGDAKTTHLNQLEQKKDELNYLEQIDKDHLNKLEQEKGQLSFLEQTVEGCSDEAYTELMSKEDSIKATLTNCINTSCKIVDLEKCILMHSDDGSGHIDTSVPADGVEVVCEGEGEQEYVVSLTPYYFHLLDVLMEGSCDEMTVIEGIHKSVANVFISCYQDCTADDHVFYTTDEDANHWTCQQVADEGFCDENDWIGDPLQEICSTCQS